MQQDGLNTLQLKLVEKKPLPLGGDQSLPNILHYWSTSVHRSQARLERRPARGLPPAGRSVISQGARDVLAAL
jgi:hypothetical protein